MTLSACIKKARTFLRESGIDGEIIAADGRNRKPHLNTCRDGWRSLRLYLLMSPRWTFGIPGIVLATIGLASLAAAILGFVPAAWLGVVHIFSTVTTVIGYQAILLAIFAKFIAIESSLRPPATKFYIFCKPGAPWSTSSF
ncbi:MAG: hypothetical protein WC076_11975 [Terrimicrobiaceae bacterium]